MSKDMLGPLTRALVSVPPKRLPLVLDVVNKVGAEDGEAWHKVIATALRNGLPKPEVPLPPTPTIVDLGVFELNRSETIAAKLAAITDPKALIYHTDWATDEKFPDTRTGKVRARASVVCFHRFMRQKGEDSVEAWCLKNKKVLALPKDGIDIAKVSPRPKLDNVMPLAMAGQLFVGVGGDRLALYFS